MENITIQSKSMEVNEHGELLGEVNSRYIPICGISENGEIVEVNNGMYHFYTKPKHSQEVPTLTTFQFTILVALLFMLLLATAI